MAHSQSPALPTQSEISAMATVLARRYGPRAGDVAQHFILEHEAVGDHVRAALWGEVCAHLGRKAKTPTLS
jgi:hypothetical protein